MSTVSEAREYGVSAIALNCRRLSGKSPTVGMESSTVSSSALRRYRVARAALHIDKQEGRLARSLGHEIRAFTYIKPDAVPYLGYTSS